MRNLSKEIITQMLIGELICHYGQGIINLAVFVKRLEKNSAAGNEITPMRTLVYI